MFYKSAKEIFDRVKKLEKDPNKRFTSKDIVEYPWLNDK